MTSLDGWMDDAVQRSAAERVLHEVAAEFLQQRPRLIEPGAVRGWCEEISQQFVDALSARGVRATVISGMEFGEMPEFPGVRLMLNGHYAVLTEIVVGRGRVFGRPAGDPEPKANPGLQETFSALEPGPSWDTVVFDWTARQFDPEAPVPLVVSLREWRERWQAMMQE